MLVELTSKQYRCSTQVQGEMEIACLVTVKMPAILKNTKVTEKWNKNMQSQKVNRYLAVLLQLLVLV